MRVTFVLPSYSGRPIGGYLVVFRYANELSRRGHEVTVVHAQYATAPEDVVSRVKTHVPMLRKRWRYGNGRPRWFDLDASVAVEMARTIRDSWVPDADAVFATACTTARAVYALAVTKGTKFYLVQHYEDWACGKTEVDATWRLPMHKVVSSQWLEKIGTELGEAGRLTRIPIGVEHDVFRMLVPPGERSAVRVGMLAHAQTDKGMASGIEALELARREVPGLEAVVFGARGRPEELPAWLDYAENPPRTELAALYNSASVFVHTSVTEGWGLTGAEAMACGCALVASDSGGVRDYAIDARTALLVPPRDPHALAAEIVRLVNDDALRIRLALEGNRWIQRFTWVRAGTQLEELITNVRLHERVGL